eukprot:9811028-Ditylum_brightwellii.AAC.1
MEIKEGSMTRKATMDPTRTITTKYLGNNILDTQGASTQRGITWGEESHFFSADDGQYGNQPGNGDN